MYFGLLAPATEYQRALPTTQSLQDGVYTLSFVETPVKPVNKAAKQAPRLIHAVARSWGAWTATGQLWKDRS